MSLAFAAAARLPHSDRFIAPVSQWMPLRALLFGSHTDWNAAFHERQRPPGVRQLHLGDLQPIARSLQAKRVPQAALRTRMGPVT